MMPAILKLWIDADAAPREVKDVIYRVARRLKLETLLVAPMGSFAERFDLADSWAVFE